MTASVSHALMQHPGLVKHTREKYREKTSAHQLPEEKEMKYIYITRPDLERPPQLVHNFHSLIFSTLTHPKRRTSNS